MVRSLVSKFFIIVFAVAFCGFIAGCQEKQAKEPAAKIEIIEPVVEVAENVAKPVVETAEKIAKPVAEVAENVAKPIVETAEKVTEPVVEATKKVLKAAEPVTEPVVETTEKAAEKVVEAAAVVASKASSSPRVSLNTSMGEIVIELNPKKAPITVKNFLRYVNEGFYNGLVFHRVIPRFMIQGGGFDHRMVEKETHLPIKNESNNRLPNARGTIAMARMPSPDSASSQFFINVNNNTSLNYGGPNEVGYAVFGKVVKGMDIVDAIVKVPTTTKVSNKGGSLANNPTKSIIIKSAKVL